MKDIELYLKDSCGCGCVFSCVWVDLKMIIVLLILMKIIFTIALEEEIMNPSLQQMDDLINISIALGKICKEELGAIVKTTINFKEKKVNEC